MGIVTALGADAPEIASAITALMAGHEELGVGVVIGSNIFNLASLLGLSAVVAGGAAVVTESFNSNTVNIVAGLCLPALIVGLGRISPRTVFALLWLGGMTIVAIALTAWRGGLRRPGGAILLLLYAAFVVVNLVWR